MEKILTDINVLIVDDDPLGRDIVSRMLNVLGANVFTAESGIQALELVRANAEIHLILADLSMPNMSGWVLNDELKDDSALADIPIIILTANASLSAQSRAQRSGFDGFIAKPISIKTFHATLADILKDIPSIASKMKK